MSDRYHWKRFWALKNGESFYLGKRRFVKTWFCIARPFASVEVKWLKPWKKVQSRELIVPKRARKRFVGDCNHSPEPACPAHNCASS